MPSQSLLTEQDSLVCRKEMLASGYGKAGMKLIPELHLAIGNVVA